MRLGVVVLPETPWEQAQGIWRDAEQLGFAHAWTYDHLAWGSLRDSPWFGAVPTLAAAATVTSRIRLGPLVASPNFRHPVAFAREVLALDDISAGRLTLGVGAGGHGWDAAMLGNAAWSAAERADRFAEFVSLLDRVLTEREVTYSGRYYSSTEARSHPGCRQQPRVPFAIAATGPTGMQLVARFGQSWVTTGPRVVSETLDLHAGIKIVADQTALLEEACRQAGRDSSDLARMVLAGPALNQGLSSAHEFADTLGAYGELGVTDFIVHWPRRDEPYRGRRGQSEQVIRSHLG